MNSQTVTPTFAGRGGHADAPSVPRSRAEEALTPQERLRLTEVEARRAGAAAEAAEAEAERERTAAKNAAQAAKRQAQDVERQEQAWAQGAAREVMRLEDRMRRLLAAKVAAPAVDPGDRARARLYLHGGSGADEVLTALNLLKRCDTHLAELFQVHAEAGHGLGIAEKHASDEILGRLDAVECKCWRELLHRCRAIAGEEDWS